MRALLGHNGRSAPAPVNQPAAVASPISGDRRDGGFYGRAVCMRTVCPPIAKAGKTQIQFKIFLTKTPKSDKV